MTLCKHGYPKGKCCPTDSGRMTVGAATQSQGISPGDAIRRANASEERVVQAVRMLGYKFIAGVVRSMKGSAEDHALCDVTVHTDEGDIRIQVKSSRGAMKVWRRRIKNNPDRARFLQGLIVVVAGDKTVEQVRDELAPQITKAYAELCPYKAGVT